MIKCAGREINVVLDAVRISQQRVVGEQVRWVWVLGVSTETGAHHFLVEDGECEVEENRLQREKHGRSGCESAKLTQRKGHAVVGVGLEQLVAAQNHHFEPLANAHLRLLALE